MTVMTQRAGARTWRGAASITLGGLEAMAALIAAGLLAAMAALPNDREDAAARTGTQSALAGAPGKRPPSVPTSARPITTRATSI